MIKLGALITNTERLIKPIKLGFSPTTSCTETFTFNGNYYVSHFHPEAMKLKLYTQCILSKSQIS